MLIPDKGGETTALKPVKLKTGSLIPVDESQTAPKFNGKKALKEFHFSPALNLMGGLKGVEEGNNSFGGKVVTGLRDTLQDIEAIPAHFFNQYLLNYPRAITEKAGYKFPEDTNSLAAGVLAKTAGVAGAIKNPVFKAFKIGPTSGMAREMVASAATGAAYSPEDPTDMKARAAQAAFGAAAPPVTRFAGKVAGSVLKAPLSAVNWAKDEASKVIDSMIKPAKGLFAYGKDPGGEVARQGIVAKNFDDFIEKTGKKLNEWGQKIDVALKKPSNQQHKIDASDSINIIDSEIESLSRFSDSNSSIIKRLNTFKDDLSRFDIQNLSPEGATSLKRKIGDMTKFTGNPSDDEIYNKTLKTVYGSLKEKINHAIPEVKEANEIYSNLLSARQAAINREPISLRRDIFSLAQKTAGGGMIAGGLATGNLPLAGGGLGLIAVEKALGSMKVKTSFAKTLASIGEADKSKFIQAVKKVPELHKLLYKVLEDVQRPLFSGRAKPTPLLPAPKGGPISSGAKGEGFSVLSEDEASIVYDVIERSREMAKKQAANAKQKMLPIGQSFKMLSPEEEALALTDYNRRVSENFNPLKQKMLPSNTSTTTQEIEDLAKKYWVSELPRNVKSTIKSFGDLEGEEKVRQTMKSRKFIGKRKRY